MKHARNRSLRIAIAIAWVSGFQAGAATWDGGGDDGLWVTPANWSGDTVPAEGDTIDIGGGATVSTAGISALHPANHLAPGATVNLMDNSTLSTGTDPVLRLGGTTVNVSAGSEITGGFWDLNHGNLSFEDGASATMSNWELKGTNVFSFALGAAGFTPLTPGTFRLATHAGTSISDSTYNVDMANYAGGAGVITLVDFEFDAAEMDDATFQGANFNVSNVPAGLTAVLQWNDTTEAIELNITGTPSGSLRITKVEYTADPATVELTWNSIPNATYTVRYTTDLSNWNSDLDDSIEADDGDSTTRSFDLSENGLDDETRLFFRVEVE